MMKNDTRKRFTLRIPDQLNERIRAESKRQGVSTNALISKILWEWSLEKSSKKESL